MRQRAKGQLIRDIPVRLLDFSLSECLVATNHPMHAGTMGELQVSFDGRPYRDTVIVVRAIRHHGFPYAHTLGSQFTLANHSDKASLSGHVPSILSRPS